MPNFYSLTLQKATVIPHAIYGNFSAPKAQEIVVSRGKVLELLRPSDSGVVEIIHSEEVFGLIRMLQPLRLVGSNRDVVLMTSDSGRIVVLEFDGKTNSFKKLHQETYGKTGCRRIVPGEYLAVDPKGRAAMIGASEKQKLVYVFNRDAQQQLTISSPLEAHLSHTLVWGICALDVGFENPMFAALEMSYEESDRDPYAPYPRKALTIYEIDLGVNHASRKHAEDIDSSAHSLIAVPGGNDGPGGVIVCCENVLRYRKVGYEEVACAIPRRLEAPEERQIMVVAHATHRGKALFFFLIQTEFGDLYKVSLQHEEGVVMGMSVQYFDTIPVASSLCVLKTGFLFAASEFGDHCLYQFQSIGEGSDDPLCSSAHPSGDEARVIFSPRPLKNLSVFHKMSSLSPITDLKAMDAAGEGGACQLYALCGRGPQSSLRILKHGLAVQDHAASELPGRPSGVWTLKEQYVPLHKVGERGAAKDKYIVVSFADVTLVLEVGESVLETTTTGLLSTAATLHVNVMADSSKLQVLPDRVRHITKNRVNEWRAAAGRTIVAADSNERQIILATSGGEVVLLEVDESHSLQEIKSRDLQAEVLSVSVQPVPAGRTRASLAAVGMVDNSVRIVSLDKERPLRQLAASAMQASPESVKLSDLRSKDHPGQPLLLAVGLSDGHLVRISTDPVTGALSDTRMKYLGARAVRLQNSFVEGGKPAVLALSSKPWLVHAGTSFAGQVSVTPLCYERLEFAAPFSSEAYPDSLVTIGQGNTLRILGVDKQSESVFNQTVVPLSYTPRKFIPLPPAKLDPEAVAMGVPPKIMLGIVESDHNAYNEETKKEIKSEVKRAMKGDEEEEEDGGMEMDEEEGNANLAEAQIGALMAGAGKWGSCVRVVDPVTASTVFKLDLDVDEAALCLTVCYFMQLRDNRPCLVVATAQNLDLHTNEARASWIKTYLYDDNWHIQLIHSTPIDEPCRAMFPFQGRLVVASGNSLRLYELGKKQLLKKCEYKGLPAGLVWLDVKGDRIFAGDVREGVHVLSYKRTENQLFVVADESRPRWTSCATILDSNTAAVGDKFDGLAVVRIPEEVALDGLDGDTVRTTADTAYITGQCHKLQQVATFHVGEMLTSLQKATLVSGAHEVLLFSTLQGSVGALYPFLSKREFEFFQSLELHMRIASPSLCGREHMAFRSFYSPVKGVIDGDLCEMFPRLPLEKQRTIAQDLDKPLPEIYKRLEEVRNRVL